MRVNVVRYQTRKRARRIAESVGSSLAGYYDKPVSRRKNGRS